MSNPAKSLELEKSAWNALKRGDRNRAIIEMHEAAKIANTPKKKEALHKKGDMIASGAIAWNIKLKKWEMK